MDTVKVTQGNPRLKRMLAKLRKPTHEQSHSPSFSRVSKPLMLALIITLAMPHFASPATFRVNSMVDREDNNLDDNTCHTGRNIIIDGGLEERECTLRAAIMQANHLPDPDTIMLPRGLFTLAIPGAFGVDDDMGTTGDLDIVFTLSIVGAGSAVTVIDGNLCPPDERTCTPQNDSVSRVFHILGGLTQISGLTIQNGGGLNTSGGAIAIGAGARLVLRDTIITRSRTGVELGRGGGIDNRGDLFIFDSTISDNVARLGGGGIANSGRLFISASTIDGNTSTSFGGGGVMNVGGGTAEIEESTVSRNKQTGGGTGGGGILNTGRLVIDNSTISGNTQRSGTPQGGGIFNSRGEVFLFNATITNNRTFAQSPGRGGGIASFGGFVLLANTIVAGNCNGARGLEEDDSALCAPRFTNDTDQRSDCAGTLDSEGFNLLGTTLNPGTNNNLESGPLDPCDFRVDRDDQGQVTDQGGQAGIPPLDPLDLGLGPLARNGGLTETHALLAGSRAISRGNLASPGGGFTCIPFDQRFLPRPFGDRCDIGAFEFGVINVPTCPFEPIFCLQDQLVETRRERRDSTPVPGGPAGTTTISLTYTNPAGNVSISNLVFEVAALTAGNLVLNADEFRGRRGVGARISAPPDQVLSPGGTITIDFIIGRQTLDDFVFVVDVLGAPSR